MTFLTFVLESLQLALLTFWNLPPLFAELPQELVILLNDAMEMWLVLETSTTLAPTVTEPTVTVTEFAATTMVILLSLSSVLVILDTKETFVKSQFVTSSPTALVALLTLTVDGAALQTLALQDLLLDLKTLHNALVLLVSICVVKLPIVSMEVNVIVELAIASLEP